MKQLTIAKRLVSASLILSLMIIITLIGIKSGGRDRQHADRVQR